MFILSFSKVTKMAHYQDNITSVQNLLKKYTADQHIQGNNEVLKIIFGCHDIHIPTKIKIVQAMVFPVALYESESQSFKSLGKILMLLKLGVGENYEVIVVLEMSNISCIVGNLKALLKISRTGYCQQNRQQGCCEQLKQKCL